MFGRSKVMHIADASDHVVAAFEAREINELVAFCGQRIARGWLFEIGGARDDAPMCDTCAAAAGWTWTWDPGTGTGEWLSPYEEVQL